MDASFNKLSWHESSLEDKMAFSPEAVSHAGKKNFQIANTAYPINHNLTLAPYRVPQGKLQDHITRVWHDVDELLLYAHVPFCAHICAFCELSVVKPKYIATDTEPYFAALQKEIGMYADLLGKGKKVKGFDIWGGTPSIVDTRYIWGIIDTIDSHFSLADDMRISIETTPRIAAEQAGKIRDYHEMGIRRISMWVQSLSGKIIGRADTSTLYNQGARDSIRQAGFEHFNVDVMYGFSGQGNDDVEATLRHVIDELGPDFITLYPMRYKGTVIEGKSKDVYATQLTDQYNIAYQMLVDGGYDIRPGKNTCSKIPGNDGLSDYLHHRVLHGTPYLGFWLWAQSFNPANNLSYNEWAHVKHNAEYMRRVNSWEFPIQDAHHLSREAAMGKMIAISFFYGGIHLDSFQKIFGTSLEEAFPKEMAYIRENEFMSLWEDGVWQLTKKWVENYSGVISLFYSPATKKYLTGISDTGWQGKSFSVRDITHQWVHA